MGRIYCKSGSDIVDSAVFGHLPTMYAPVHNSTGAYVEHKKVSKIYFRRGNITYRIFSANDSFSVMLYAMGRDGGIADDLFADYSKYESYYDFVAAFRKTGTAGISPVESYTNTGGTFYVFLDVLNSDGSISEVEEFPLGIWAGTSNCAKLKVEIADFEKDSALRKIATFVQNTGYSKCLQQIFTNSGKLELGNIVGQGVWKNSSYIQGISNRCLLKITVPENTSSSQENYLLTIFDATNGYSKSVVESSSTASINFKVNAPTTDYSFRMNFSNGTNTLNISDRHEIDGEAISLTTVGSNISNLKLSQINVTWENTDKGEDTETSIIDANAISDIAVYNKSANTITIYGDVIGDYISSQYYEIANLKSIELVFNNCSSSGTVYSSNSAYINCNF